MGTHVRETSARVSGVLADSVKADSPANGRPVFRGELSFERAERSTWRILCRGIGCGESNFPVSWIYTDYLNPRERRMLLTDRVTAIMEMESH